MIPGLQASQAIHAVVQFQDEYPTISDLWFKQSNFIAILSVKDDQHLRNLMKTLQDKDIKYSAFREPDLDNSITALAIEPGEKSRKVLSSLPLALKKYIKKE